MHRHVCVRGACTTWSAEALPRILYVVKLGGVRVVACVARGGVMLVGMLVVGRLNNGARGCSSGVAEGAPFASGVRVGRGDTAKHTSCRGWRGRMSGVRGARCEAVWGAAWRTIWGCHHAYSTPSAHRRHPIPTPHAARPIAPPSQTRNAARVFCSAPRDIARPPTPHNHQPPSPRPNRTRRPPRPTHAARADARRRAGR